MKRSVKREIDEIVRRKGGIDRCGPLDFTEDQLTEILNGTSELKVPFIKSEIVSCYRNSESTTEKIEALKLITTMFF